VLRQALFIMSEAEGTRSLFLVTLGERPIAEKCNALLRLSL